MNTRSIHQISLSDDETLVKVKKTKAKRPNYRMIGNDTMNKHNIKSICLIDAMADSSSAGRELIRTITKLMVFDPKEEGVRFIIKLKPGFDIPPQILKRAYKELHAIDLVRRVKQSHYMLNPNAMITNYEKQMEVWDAIQ